ncbi:MAG: hypothetical protein AMJ42_06040 [Deltaproteobacteria bacterium DG_8]|nr:MAG: hypothetical protein AMJ42_06040 [Deltaproteobacteria bacterium DG_8]
MRKICFACFLIVSLIVTFSSVANAIQFKRDRSVTVPKGEVIEGDLYAFCEILTIDGTITGDLISFSRFANINGTVQGDIISAGRNVELRGVVEDDFRVIFARKVLVNGFVKKNVTVFCRDFFLAKEGTTGQNVLFHCRNSNIKGKILGSIYGIGGVAELTGEVGKDVDVRKILKVSISPTSHIKGNLKISGNDIKIAPEALIEGKIEKKEWISKRIMFSSFILKLNWLIAAILIGVLTIKFMPRLTQNIIVEIQQYWKCMGIGLIALIFSPIAIILIALTFIGLPLSLLSLLFYIALLYLSTIFVGIVAGMLILRLFKKPFQVSLASMIVGLLVLHILFAVPSFGLVVRIVTLILGFGMVVSGGLKFIREAA